MLPLNQHFSHTYLLCISKNKLGNEINERMRNTGWIYNMMILAFSEQREILKSTSNQEGGGTNNYKLR